ncbi:hypothetical protein G3A_14065 [Bacillus sp. 17376]|uniref:PD-(D/E)XK nuclease superfamily protein n=1 Tax=Mesobacillus boroniphilus JCM 21738 TaxID=1294265 RepID=W4RMZ0_9BACI|nr:PD-(D/E)XK nuclease family protein [Mesobacillus boroniphilus]ESU31936.1 hypothetical protein G3A_14065 [Bacillus sp. 17376]GAE45800.1 hypothetical protein JCM21738_2646 [Mesobacillus boroniphilus JCM 21738]
MKPNLFFYSTSELSQDAFLCWMFAHVQMKTNDIVEKVGRDFISHILTQYQIFSPKFDLIAFQHYEIKVDRQINNIDILLTLIAGSKITYIIIEDKILSGESKEKQPEFYRDQLKKSAGNSTIIPVLFKTGYSTIEEQARFKNREVVFLGYNDIHNIFSAYGEEVKEDLLLNDWWVNFNEKYYTPIAYAQAYTLNPALTLKEIAELSRKTAYPERIIFQKITDTLFQDITDVQTKTFSVQGKGHVDWHFEIFKKNWMDEDKNISVSIYFIWDTYNFSLVIKTAPRPYKPLKKLTVDELSIYTEAKQTIQNRLKQNQQIHWKLTNYYLQVAQMQEVNNISLNDLKFRINNEIAKVIGEIDNIMTDKAPVV